MSMFVDTSHLAPPPDGWRWEYEVQEHSAGKLTAWLRLFDEVGALRQRGQIALEMYGDAGVREKAQRMLQMARVP